MGKPSPAGLDIGLSLLAAAPAPFLGDKPPGSSGRG
jgi:hypothetical protein